MCTVDELKMFIDEIVEPVEKPFQHIDDPVQRGERFLLCKADLLQINVKATTEEHLGFTGDGSGMACHAVCLLEEK